MKKQLFKILSLFLIIFLTSCATTKNATKVKITKENVSMLAGQKWYLSEFKNGDKLIDLPKTSIPFIEFKIDDKQITGLAGCNRFFTNFSFNEDDKLKFGPMAGTKMICEFIDLETLFYSNISNANKIILENNNLIFYNESNNTIATFKK